MEDKEAHAAGSKQQPYWKPWQGGFRGAMFIFVLAAFENMAFVANMVNLVLYFMWVMHFGVSGSANTLTVFMGCSFFLSILGGYISDTFLSRFTTGLVFGVVELLGLGMLTIQAHYPHLQPVPCKDKLSPCKHVRGGKAVLFYATLCLLGLGSGGVRGSVPALGGDQFNAKDPKERRSLATYFNWLLLSVTIGGAFGVTFIVYLSTVRGWDMSFFMSFIATFVGFTVLALGKPFYRIQPPGDSPIRRIIQVIVVSYRNRRHPLPLENHELYEINDKETSDLEEKIAHTNQFRFLDKAAALKQGSEPDRWKVCTVTQVEEVKILIRMLPILGSTILMNTCLAQLQTFSVQQGAQMNRHLGSFEVPAASVPVIPLVFMSILLPMYEYIFVPFARKITNHPTGITQLQRVGVGLVLSVVSMAIAGMVEVKRKNQSIKNPAEPISLFWLSFQFSIFGIADMFTLVGLLEFFYKEAPIGMRSLSTSLTWLSLSIGYFLSTVFVEIINCVTKRVTKSKKGWLSGKDLDSSNLQLFYWFLAILSFLNFLVYLFCATWYKYKEEDVNNLELPSKVSIESSFQKEEAVEDFEVKVQNASSPSHTRDPKESEEKQDEQSEEKRDDQ